MLYFIHHPVGNVVIRTNSPNIVLQYQIRGWLTTTSWGKVLHDHPEWRPPRYHHANNTNDPTTSLPSRICKALAALERKWYHERNLPTPDGGWIICTDAEEALDYQLASGIWELDMVPAYGDALCDEHRGEK
ncbi:hypothetical protein EK21DRAFT_99691 [Setomelanomma holmii]|uniref:Uncharacterized protein n=1 Tax=Setomelanomma holmii TaxID=210430 RepID=A0A9P4HEE5_9PLEO|nr:hypothetical protein EK21DRAFT_99691 [Setomelanomma holmii]